jgi:trigger factor
MQVRIEDVSPVEKKLFVEVPWDTVSTRLGDAYRELSKGVQIKGFRKGKVPRPVLEKMYAPRVHAEVSYQLVRESFYQAVAQHQLAAVAEPQVEEASSLEKGKPYIFSAIVEVRTEVVPQDYVGMTLERPSSRSPTRPSTSRSSSCAASTPSSSPSRAARSPPPAT